MLISDIARGSAPRDIVFRPDASAYCWRKCQVGRFPPIFGAKADLALALTHCTRTFPLTAPRPSSKRKFIGIRKAAKPLQRTLRLRYVIPINTSGEDVIA